MRKKYQELLNVLILLTLYLGVFIFPTYIIKSGVVAITIFKEKMFPSIFPFFVLSFLMLNLGISQYICILFEKVFYRLFHLKGDSIFVILMSIISGFPSGPKYIGKLYQENKLTKEESNYLLLFTHFANPLFIFGTCSLLLKDYSLARDIFFSQLFANIILGFLFRQKKTKYFKKNTLQEFKKAFQKEHMPFLLALPDAINNAMEVSLFMLGSITFFMFVSQIITKLFSLSGISQTILTGLLDLTSGISLTATLPYIPKIRAMIMLTFITFGSFSVHLQVLNALRKTDLSYHYFFLGRIYQTAIAIILFLIFMIH